MAGLELLNPLIDGPRARFLAFEGARAGALHAALTGRGVVTDLRGDVIRVGFGLYHDDADVDGLSRIVAECSA